VLQKRPHSGRLASKLAFQLAPAVIVSAVGIVLLGSLAKAPEPAPVAAPAVTVIQAEATYRIIPRETADAETGNADDADARRAKATAPRPAKPKAAAAKEPAPQQRKLATVEPATPAPAEPPPAPAAPQPGPANAAAPPAAADGGNFIVTGWRRVTAATERLSQWVQPPSGWFERSPPPRPPAPIPEQNFANVSL
jgi:hypothetical protein